VYLNKQISTNFNSVPRPSCCRRKAESDVGWKIHFSFTDDDDCDDALSLQKIPNSNAHSHSTWIQSRFIRQQSKGQ